MDEFDFQSLWHSPVTEDQTQRIPVTPVVHKMQNEGNKFHFNIHMDSSMTQHAMSAAKNHQAYNPPVYNDQENLPQYMNSYNNDENQSSFNQSVGQNSYHYHVQVLFRQFSKRHFCFQTNQMNTELIFLQSLRNL